MSVKNSEVENTPSVKQESKDKGSDDQDFQKKTPLIALIVAVVSIVISVLTYIYYLTQASYEKRIQGQKFVISTLREMNEIQDELQRIRSRISGTDNLTEKEMLLLNYYEVLSKVFAENKDVAPALYKWGICNHESSVRIRKKPSKHSTQIGGVVRNDRVVILGKFSYNKNDVWYYIIAPDKKIGWGYKHFEIYE